MEQAKVAEKGVNYMEQAAQLKKLPVRCNSLEK